jgi:hypothetical protein
MVAVVSSASQLPELAVLVSPEADSPEAKMFMLKSWNVGSQAYTVVKEDQVPDVPLEMRLKFSIAIVDSLYDSDEFSGWASAWYSGDYQDGTSIEAVANALEKERDGIKALEQMAGIAEGSGAQAKRQKEIVNRVTVLLDAAKSWLSPSHDNDKIQHEIASVMEGIMDYVSDEDLMDIVAKTVNQAESALETEC